MRPIEKGPCPQVNGTDKTVTDYKEWRRDLIERIGYYCVYCNMPLSHQLHVEHVVPKSPVSGHPAGDPLAWENMLLACEKCNKAKSNKPSDPTIHYLPEYHNGLLPFIAIPGGIKDSLIIGVRASLNPDQTKKAENTLRDFEWDKIDTRGSIVDIRWMKRNDALKVVQSAQDLLEMAKGSPTYSAPDAGRMVATIALDTGFFLLWFEAFAHEPEVLRYLADPSLYPGVATSCFPPPTYKPSPRNPANPTDPI